MRIAPPSPDFERGETVSSPPSEPNSLAASALNSLSAPLLLVGFDGAQKEHIEQLLREIFAAPNSQFCSDVNAAARWCQNQTPLVVLLDASLPDGKPDAQNAREFAAPVVLLVESDAAPFDLDENPLTWIETLECDDLNARRLARAIGAARAKFLARTQLNQALAHNKQLETALESAGVGILVAHPQRDETGQFQTVVSGVNATFERLTGFADHEVVGQKLPVLDGPETDGEMIRALDAALAAGEPLGATMLCYRRDGTSFWNAFQLSPLRSARGEVCEWVALISDASPRMAAENALRQSQENLAAAQKLTQLGSWQFDLQAPETENRLFWSDELFRIFGFEPQIGPLSSELHHSLIHPEDRQIAAELSAAVEAGRDCDLEYRIVRPDGETRAIQVHSHIERDAKGVPLRVIGTVWDITERQSAQKRARDARRQLQMVLQNAPIIICAFDMAGVITFIEGQALQLFSENDPNPLGQSIFEIYSENLPLQNLAKRALEGEDNWDTIEIGGSFLETKFCALRDENGVISGAVGLSYDVTERERAKRELEQSKSRFGRIVANVPGMVYRFRREPHGEYVFDFVSEGCRAIYGIEPEAIYQRPEVLFEVVEPAGREAFFDSISASARDLSPWNWESYITRFDGEQRYIRGASRPERQSDGSTVWDGLIMDLTQQHRDQNELLRSRRALDQAQKLAKIGSFEWDLTRGEIFWSDEMFHIFGQRRGEFAPTLPELFDFVLPSHREEVQKRVDEAIHHGNAESMVIPIARRDGEIRWLQTRSHIESDAAGRATTIVGSAQDITENLEASRALRESEQRYALAAQGANDGLWDWNLQTNRIYFSPRWKSMLGFAVDEISDAPSEWLERVHPDDGERLDATMIAHLSGAASHFECEYRVLCANGTYRWMLCRALAVFDSKTGKTGAAPGENHASNRNSNPVASRIAGSQTDISERKAAEAQLSRNAFYDKLTGLPNRALLLDRLERSLARAHRNPQYAFATLFLDLDHFKKVNDTLGHLAGDQLLIEVAARFSLCLRPGDTVARLGGDEFAILVDDIRDDRDVSMVAERIQRGLERPILLENKEVYVTVSIGMAPFTGDETAPKDLLRNADSAMYRAKSLGRARSEVFDSATHQRAVQLLELESDLWHAIERDEFCLHFQPIIALETGKICGYEALVRWQHPTRGLISPADFIPIAEQNGFILLLGWWVLETACRQIHDWNTQRAAQFPGERAHFVSVNVSSRQFSQPDMNEQVRRVIDRTGVDPHNLTLEITESVIMEHNELASATLRGLRARGIHLSMDDFGTGYSSLSYLHRFSLDTLKIDRSFISQMRSGARDGEIVNTILSLAASLNMKVVAEGVETAEQLAGLRRMKCGYAQGFFFSKPVPAAQIEALWKNPTQW